jgi:hypothetical protein
MRLSQTLYRRDASNGRAHHSISRRGWSCCSISEYWSGARHAHTSGQKSSPGSRPIAKGTYWSGPSAPISACPQMALNRHQCRLVACLLIRVKRTCPIHGVMSAPDPKSRRWLPVQTLAARHILIRPRIGLSMGPAAPRAYLRVAVCTWHCWSAKAWAEDVIDDCYRQTPHQRRY